MSNRSLNLKILKSLSLGFVLLAGAGAVSTDGWGALVAAAAPKGFGHQLKKWSPTTEGKAMRMESKNKKRDKDVSAHQRLSEARKKKQDLREQKADSREGV